MAVAIEADEMVVPDDLEAAALAESARCPVCHRSTTTEET